MNQHIHRQELVDYIRAELIKQGVTDFDIYNDVFHSVIHLRAKNTDRAAVDVLFHSMNGTIEERGDNFEIYVKFISKRINQQNI